MADPHDAPHRRRPPAAHPRLACVRCRRTTSRCSTPSAWSPPRTSRADRAAELRQLRDGRLRRGARRRGHRHRRAARCTCPVVGEIGAGQARILAMSPGTAVKIMTGAPVPAGADAVVPYEWTDRGVAQVVITQAPEQGQHVRSAGEDVSRGRPAHRGGHPARPAPARPAGQRRPRVGRRPPPAARGDPVDGLRAARARAPPAATTRSTTATPTCSPRPYAARARSPTASASCPTSRRPSSTRSATSWCAPTR